MKSKPDISSFSKAPKDPTAFLEGASADQSETSSLTEHQTAAGRSSTQEQVSDALKPSRMYEEADAMPVPTVQKLFRLRWDTANALRMGAARLSIKQAKRVTETEIVEALVRKHFELDS